jgi:hypothetical protein
LEAAEECWEGNGNITARTARIEERTRRKVVEEMDRWLDR